MAAQSLRTVTKVMHVQVRALNDFRPAAGRAGRGCFGRRSGSDTSYTRLQRRAAPKKILGVLAAAGVDAVVSQLGRGGPPLRFPAVGRKSLSGRTCTRKPPDITGAPDVSGAGPGGAGSGPGRGTGGPRPGQKWPLPGRRACFCQAGFLLAGPPRAKRARQTLLPGPGCE